EVPGHAHGDAFHAGDRGIACAEIRLEDERTVRPRRLQYERGCKGAQRAPHRVTFWRTRGAHISRGRDCLSAMASSIRPSLQEPAVRENRRVNRASLIIRLL